MFICQKCGKQVGKGVASELLTIKTREKIYKTYNTKEKRDKVSKGFEIVEEIRVCSVCKGGNDGSL